MPDTTVAPRSAPQRGGAPTDPQAEARRRDEAGTPRPGCPKRMVFGPCGGVRADGGCEVDGHRCPFLDVPAARWERDEIASGAAAPMPAVPPDRPLVVCDVRAPEPTVDAARRLLARCAGWCDALLLGDHHDRVDLPGLTLAQVAMDAGCAPWLTMSCRDRNRVVLEADLAACRQLGVPVVHCVTGDARAPHVRPDATQVFDLDSLRLTALARDFGLTVSVAATPTAPPMGLRPTRLADKARAGASWCFINVGVRPAEVEAFIAAARRAGAQLRYLACVAMFTDEPGASALRALPGVRLDPAVCRRVLRAPDPVGAGVEVAVEQARRLLEIDGVAGVNLSGPASTVSADRRLAVMRAAAEQLR